MKIAISGSSGLLGSSLVRYFTDSSYKVSRMVRSKETRGEGDIFWQPDAQVIEGLDRAAPDVVIHLGGYNIASGYWTPKRKEKIRASRVQSTKFLCDALAVQPNPPKLLITASAIGYYGDCGDSIVDETAPAGSGFLADVCSAWERATSPLQDTGTRVVHLRFGVVLSRRGGALKMMLPAFRLGLGGKVGNGSQYMSWITINDIVRIISKIIDDVSITGPVNAVAPGPITNRDFARTLAGVLRRPALIPIPAAVIRLMLGELGMELLLSSARVVPAKLLAVGFQFEDDTLEAALQKILQEE